jgi:hypothetical protein
MTGYRDQVAAAQRRRERFLQMRSTVTPSQAQNMARLARENPSLSPGALLSGGMGGIQPGTAASRALSKGDQRVQAERSRGNWFQRGISATYKGVKVVGSALTPDFVGATVNATMPVVKGVSRGADIGLSSIGQTVQGVAREWADDGELELGDIGRGFAQTDLASANREVRREGGYLGLLTGSTDVNYGSGFFAGGDVASDAKRRRLAAAPLIGGKGMTIGRYGASQIGLEPGNLAYNIVSGLADAAVMLGTDPTSYAAAPIKALQARRLFVGDASKGFDAVATAARVDEGLATAKAERFGLDRDRLLEDMGAVGGIRNTVNSDRVLEWLTTKKEGQRLVRVLAGETDFGKLYDMTKGKVDPETLLRISDRKMTGDEVIEILGPQLGRTARTDEKFRVDAVARANAGIGGVGTLATAKFKQRVRDARMFGAVPERVLPKNDLNETLRNASDFMRNARVDAVDRSEILKRFAQANGGEGMLDVTMQMMRAGAAKAIDEFGIDPDRARQLFKIYENSSSGRRKFWQEQVVVQGEKYWRNKGYNITDEILDDGGVRAVPHLASQFLDNNIPLPDPREIRRELSRYRYILGNKAVRLPAMAAEKIQDNIFKPGVLLRPAYVARNQIDEQFRPAAAGYASMMSHPVQYIQWLMTDQAGVGKVLSNIGFASRGATYGPDGQYFDETADSIRRAREAYKDAQRGGTVSEIEEAKGVLNAAKSSRASQTPFTQGVSEFERAITGGLGNWRNRSYAQINGDELYQRSDANYARAMGEALHRIHNDPLARRIAAGEDLDQLKQDWWRGPLQAFRGDLAKQGERMAYLNDEVGAAQYVDDTVEFVRTFVGDSPELRKAAATGRIAGVALTAGDSLEIHGNALKVLDDLKQMDAFQGPDAVIGSTLLKGGMEEGSAYTRAVDWMFYQLADRPTRYLSKSPVFRQRYYKRMENLIGFMDPKAADDLIESARVANLRDKDIARLASKRRPGGRMTFEEADLVGKTDALEFVNGMFYSLHHRSQIGDMLRLVFPFAEAFKDSAMKYSELAAKNPVVPYRLQQVIEGARNGDLNGDGEGFFYTDEQTGEEMFSFPLSGAFMGLIGQEGAGKFRAPVKNLNILGTSVIPGFGPAVQTGAAYMLPDEADFNALQTFISPYGERSLEGGVLETFLPSWFSKWRTAFGGDMRSPAQQRAFTQTKKDWMGYLASTGEYDITDPMDAQRMMDDAAGKARATFFIRGMAQAFAPSPPSPEFVAYDKDGKLQTQFRLAELYRDIEKEQREAGTPEATNRVFIEAVGEQAVLAVVPNTKAAEGRSPLPPNKEAMEFYQDNRKAAERFPTVFGLFAPNEEGAEFDFKAYQRSLDNGERVPVTPEEAVRRANSNVARMIFDNAKAVVGDDPTPEQRSQLKELRARLAEDFPGYSTSFNNATPGLIEDLKRAAKDPQLGKTDAGQGLQIWLQAREAAEAGAQAQFGVSWKQSPKAQPIRDTMRALAEELSNDFPGFSNIYERALEDEMARD